MGIAVTALALLVFAVFLVGSFWWQEKRLRQELQKEVRRERLRRIAWERAAGLPFWDDQETENALWVRAKLDRDPLAEDVLETLYFDDPDLRS